MDPVDDRVVSVDVRTHALTGDALDPSDVVAGVPQTASAVLAALGDTEVGIWEMTAGTVRDTEVDEVFVVLSGDATVRFEDRSALELRPGVAVRLHAGDRTVWEVRERLRKVYVA
ncbi:cupin domain-containing protein [Mumia sp. zg.B21]|uniref:cupin domain-containing protein n=1 Tax=unclassified Mumia TaxID=2621872 RepID=UPI001C6F4777|nr:MULTISPECIES: cupin domain-containing protein [unclassified Mumia]MBW9209631.1 cupin domain-containing protein [Mumia sp. zg.B21]MDD9350173.1 cupin domain-containing protein [Mumia sp.]